MYMLLRYISWRPVRRLQKSLGPSHHQTSGPGIGGNRSMFSPAREAEQNRRESRNQNRSRAKGLIRLGIGVCFPAQMTDSCPPCSLAVISVPTSTMSTSIQTTSEIPQQDDDDDDWEEDDDSLESDDDGRVYKNPRNSPSTECPRDEEQATLLGQKCLRKCSSDEDCKSKKKKCLCDGVCGNSCIKPGGYRFKLQ